MEDFYSNKCFVDHMFILLLLFFVFWNVTNLLGLHVFFVLLLVVVVCVCVCVCVFGAIAKPG